jgi:DNA-binding NarL/FixJ family response regulator
MTPDNAADALKATSPRKLDPDAIDAVLGAAGHATIRAPQPWPGGLTDRQVEVLRLLATGLTNKQIARRLHLSPRTAEHHVQDIYTRLGVSSRAPAALFAMEHNLLGPASEFAAPVTRP